MNEQLADLMTKNLSFDKLKFFRNALGITFDEITNVNYTRTLLPYWVLVKMPLKKFNKYVDQNQDIMDEEYVETIMKQCGISRVLDGMESDTDSMASYTLEEYIQDKKFYDSKELIKAQFIG